MSTITKTTTLGLIPVALAAVVALAIGPSTLAIPAAGTPAAKATASVSQTQLLSPTTAAGWTTLLSNTIRTPNKKDLFMDVSLETGLMTKTLSSSKGGNKDTSTATAEVRVRCLLDGRAAYPGEVTFDARTQELSATLEGIIGSCFHIDSSGNVVLDPTCVQPEQIELIINTMSAHSFDFIYPNCDTGVHTFEVQAKIVTSTEVQSGQAEALALIGRGSCGVEEVRMANNEVIDLP